MMDYPQLNGRAAAVLEQEAMFGDGRKAEGLTSPAAMELMAERASQIDEEIAEQAKYTAPATQIGSYILVFHENSVEVVARCGQREMIHNEAAKRMATEILRRIVQPQPDEAKFSVSCPGR